MNRSVVAAALTAVTILAAPAKPPAAALAAGGPATRQPQVTAKRGMVASAHALASMAGLEMLKAGGNAVDAAVAAAFAIGVVEPNASGIGGEGMMVIHLAGPGTAVAIDYRSAAPAAVEFPDGLPDTGHAAVAVPGTVAGLTMALRKYGTLPLARVLAPAVRLAEEGFVISPTLAGVILDNFDAIRKNAPLARLLAPGGLPLEAGDTLKNPDLAASLRAIAAGGADAFYKGALADALAAEMAAHGGRLTKADLASYKAVEREPVRGRYRGYDIVSAPPPVGGVALIEILHILETFDLSREAPLSPRYVHLAAEAMKRGFADYAAAVGDPDFVKVPVETLISRDYAERLRKRIEPGKATPSDQVRPGTSFNLKDGQVAMVVGSPGGARIITTVMQVILNVIDHGMTIREAVDAPRVHLQWIPDELRIEKNGLSADTAEKLRAMGYKIQVRANMGDVNAILVDPQSRAFLIASDPRNEF